MQKIKFPDVVIKSEELEKFNNDQYALVDFGCHVLKTKLNKASGTTIKGIDREIITWLQDCKDLLLLKAPIEHLFGEYFTVE